MCVESECHDYDSSNANNIRDTGQLTLVLSHPSFPQINITKQPFEQKLKWQIYHNVCPDYKTAYIHDHIL